MKLFLCKNIEGGPGWDQTVGMVVRAESYGAAKRLVMANAIVKGGSSKWKIMRLHEGGNSGVIMHDYIAG